MSTKTKRTYNLSLETVERVRDLAANQRVAPSQDRVVEMAVEQLYLGVREAEEAKIWAQAAEDPAFRSEMRALESSYRHIEDWPE
jgi:hypothetical protein